MTSFAEQKKKKLTAFENKFMFTKGDFCGCGWTGVFTPWYLERLAKGDLVHSTENSTQYTVKIYLGKGSEIEWLCVPV